MKPFINIVLLAFTFCFYNISFSQTTNCSGDKCSSLKISKYMPRNVVGNKYVLTSEDEIIYFYKISKANKKDFESFRIVKFGKNLVKNYDTTVVVSEDIISYNIYAVRGESATYVYVSALLNIKKAVWNRRVWCYEFNKEGKVKESEKLATSALAEISIFASENGLTVLGSSNLEFGYSLVSGLSPNEKSDCELSFITFSKGDLKGKIVGIKKPENIDFRDKKHDYGFWQYVYTSDNIHYLMLTDERDKSNMTHHFFGVSESGEITKEYKIMNNLSKDVFVRRTGRTDANRNDRRIEPGLYEFYINYYSDSKNKCFYLFGLTGPEEDKNFGNIYDGVHISKYNYDGKLVWKKEFSVVKEHAENKGFKTHYVPSGRRIFLKFSEDNSLVLLVESQEESKGPIDFNVIETSRYFIKDSDGSLIKSNMCKFNSIFNYNNNYSDFIEKENSKAEEFVLKFPEKGRTFWDFNIFNINGQQILIYIPQDVNFPGKEGIMYKVPEEFEMFLMMFNDN